MSETNEVAAAAPPSDAPTSSSTPEVLSVSPPVVEAPSSPPPVEAPGMTPTNGTQVTHLSLEDNAENPSNEKQEREAQDEEEIVFGESNDDNDNNNKNNNNNNNNSEKSETPPMENVDEKRKEADDIGNHGNSKGAQILLNRFSTWRQTANQNAQELFLKNKPIIPEGAKNLWKQGPVIPEAIKHNMPRFPNVNARASNSKDDDDDGGGGEETKFTTSESSFVDASSIGQEEDEVTDPNSEPKGGVDTDKEGTTNEADHENTTSEEPRTSESQPQRRVGVALRVGAAAASVVAESVATNFRGRYANKQQQQQSQAPPATPPPTNNKPKSSPESQTALILKSRVAKHMQDILDQLEPHEYAMLLGNGMLGVNLKQCYLKQHGVFIDFLVQGGQAKQASVVKTGDLLVRVGDMDLRKGTIVEIPQTIAKSKRPIVLVLATGTQVPLERMNYVDVTVAMMHRARAETGQKTKIRQPAPPVEGQTEAAPQTVEDASAPHSLSNATIPVDNTVDGFVTPPAPTLEIRTEFVKESAQRSNDKFIVSELCEVASFDSNFRAAARNAFLTCAIDSRKLPFLARQLSEEELPEGNIGGPMTPSAQLMLFLELYSFLDLYSVTPKAHLRDIATRIAHKFFLPSKVGNRLQPPLFDFHQIAPDSSLRHLEAVLNAKTDKIPRDVFLDFSTAVVDSLTGLPFISFLASGECARMRAHLRNTAPYVNLPLHDLLEAVVTVDTASCSKQAQQLGAKNSFAFMLLFLVCQLEKEPAGEHSFLGDESVRQVGAASGLCCVVFLRRVLLPTVASAKKRLEEKADDVSAAQEVVQVFSKFWDFFLCGPLESVSKSNDFETCYKAVRTLLETISAASDATTPVASNKAVMDMLLDSKLMDAVENLADELLYDYAVNVHTKFREHKYHEWMCNELSKMRAGDPTWSSKLELPVLPQGCVKRLLRRVELPAGVSAHKPYRVEVPDESEETKREYPNADYAVVFGSSAGTDLALQTPIPAMDASDICRYACMPVALDREPIADDASFQVEEILPATFENYAMVPPTKAMPFGETAEEMRLSTDGWEVSLVNFIIPNAESSTGDATESALFGVSIVFQQIQSEIVIENEVKTQLVFEEPADKAKEVQTPEKPAETPKKEMVYDTEDLAIAVDTFASPIVFETSKKASIDIEATSSNEEPEGVIRKVKVSAQTPTFNQKLQESSWVGRALRDEYRDQKKPITIGLALVSKSNVILAMRDTLSKLLFDYSRKLDSKNGKSKPSITCGALIEVLGAFSHQDVETSSLRCILEPYLRSASSPWIDRPLMDQKVAFETLAMQQLTDCIPPTPLALLFVTALLEQKIVLSSSRRSVLHGACVGLATMLRPLKWSHLLVPLVPAALSNDLIQYPAPYILGIPAQDAENMAILGNLPKDVTLVDLDVGRVILAPAFGKDNDMVRGTEDSEVTARALRSQVLYLAQALGSVFGNILRKDTWCCDNPSFVGLDRGVVGRNPTARLDGLRSAAQEFIEELLEGSTSCCYWIEEATQGYGATEEPTVLFDEDRFFHIKNARAGKTCSPLFNRDTKTDLALSLEDFDLILESFLRCQSMSTYISSRPKSDMLYY